MGLGGQSGYAARWWGSGRVASATDCVHNRSDRNPERHKGLTLPDATNHELSDLPYLDEYLNAVLRPRVERAIEELRASLTDAAWAELVRLIAQEQRGDISEEAVRTLLTETLGLELNISVSATFNGEAAQSQGAADVIDEKDREVEQVEVRRRGGGRPLVNAILRSDSKSK